LDLLISKVKVLPNLQGQQEYRKNIKHAFECPQLVSQRIWTLFCDPRKLASLSRDFVIILQDLHTKKSVSTMNKHQDLDFDIDNELYGVLNQSSSTGATILEDMNESDDFDFDFDEDVIPMIDEDVIPITVMTSQPSDIEFEFLPNIKNGPFDASNIRPADVLMGHSPRLRVHAGNIAFNEIIATKFEQYCSSTKRDKTALSWEILDTIHSKGGKFLKQDKKDDALWKEVSNAVARDKVSSSFRGKLKKKKKEMKREKEASQSSSRIGSLSAVIKMITNPKTKRRPSFERRLTCFKEFLEKRNSWGSHQDDTKSKNSNTL